MHQTLNGLTEVFERLPQHIRRRRWLIWLSALAVIAGLSMGMGRLQSDLSFENFFAEDDPIKVAYNRYRDSFGSDEALFIAYRPADGDVFSADSLTNLAALHWELDEAIVAAVGPMARITEIRSLINADYLEVQGHTLLSRDFIGHSLPETDADREDLRRQALEHDFYPGLYLSADSQYGAIVLRTDFNARRLGTDTPPETSATSLDEDDFGFDANASSPSTTDASPATVPKFQRSEMPDYAATVAAVNQIVENPRYSSAFTIYEVGNPALMAWAFRAMSQEMGIVMTGLLLLISLTLWLLFRSASAIVWPLSIVTIGMVVTFGLMGWIGYPVNNFMQILTFLILAVGVADAIHILSGYVFFRDRGLSHEQALCSTYRKSGVACVLTTLTTSVGLFALTFVPMMPIRQFGQMAAFGIWAVLLATLILLPVMLDLWSPRRRDPGRPDDKERLIQRALSRIEGIALGAPKMTLAGFAVGAVVIGIGAKDIRVDTNLLDNIDEDVPIRVATEIVDRHLAGSSSIEVLLDTGRADGFKAPAILESTAALQDELQAQHQGLITKTVSLADVVADSYAKLNDNASEFKRVPEDPRVLSQVLFLFESANAKDRRQLVTDDYRQGHISILMKNVGSTRAAEVFEDIKARIERVFGPLRAQFPGLTVTLTGMVPMQVAVRNIINSAQLQSLSIAFGVILILMPLVFGSLKIGLIGMIPNIFPLIAVFGLMGFFGIRLDVHTLLIAPIIIGIAVDDTIHFLTHYRLEMAKHGDTLIAISNTFHEVGQAVIFTSVVLSSGFLIFVVSSDKGLSAFGVLSAVAMAVALACDLLLLPAILGGRAKAQRATELASGGDTP